MLLLIDDRDRKKTARPERIWSALQDVVRVPTMPTHSGRQVTSI
jgi:hypothetical protein